MVQKVDWSPNARHSFNRILDFLQHQWNEEIAARFALLAEEKILMVQHHPEIGSISGDSGYRKLLVQPYVVLYYEYLPETDTIKLRLFWDTRQDANRLKLLLQ